MKRTLFIFLSMLLILSACSIDENQVEPDSVQTKTIQNDSLDFISDALSEATDGYKFEIIVTQNDGKAKISVMLQRTAEGADIMFAELLPPTVEAAKNSLTETGLSLYEFNFGFLLYYAGITETADEIISWESDNLETGSLADTLNDVFNKDVSPKEVLDIYA